MKMVFEHEWKIPVPWGKLALLRHGRTNGEPVLLVHGRQDSSSVFHPLLAMMPDHYNYVALDMPGNGLSDEFPHGVKLTRFHFLAAMAFAVEHLGWDKFIFIGHSMGCEQGLFFNVVHPNRITKMILLDAGPTFMRMQVENLQEYQHQFYDSYYENYKKENFQRKVYTRHTALQALKRLRDLNDQQAATLLERNFHNYEQFKDKYTIDDKSNIAHRRNEAQTSNEALPLDEARKQNESSSSTQLSHKDNREHNIVRDGTPTEARPLNEAQPFNEAQTQHMRDTDTIGFLSWDFRLKTLAPQNYGNDYYFELFKTIPPTLLVAASEGAKNVPPNSKWRQGAEDLLGRMATLNNFHRVDVEGGHDVHFTNPERVVQHVLTFLSEDSKIISKL